MVPSDMSAALMHIGRRNGVFSPSRVNEGSGVRKEPKSLRFSPRICGDTGPGTFWSSSRHAHGDDAGEMSISIAIRAARDGLAGRSEMKEDPWDGSWTSLRVSVDGAEKAETEGSPSLPYKSTDYT